MTHELFALMLGVHREGVTETGGKRQKFGVIQFSRGQIKTLDRPRLGTTLLRVLSRPEEGI